MNDENSKKHMSPSELRTEVEKQLKLLSELSEDTSLTATERINIARTVVSIFNALGYKVYSC